ncbi:hypothetical protein DFS34DRAFT_650274 [Phlyctochytrium arcticum]|nr:hypothetical protein DFS34DRAFT_650274 [Phlyctochytrium arcticum]
MDVANAASKLTVELPDEVLTKAGELMRLANSRNVTSILKRQATLLPFLCLHISCELRHEHFPHSQVLTQTSTSSRLYADALSKLRAALGVPPPQTTFHSLAVRFGATQLITAADQLLQGFQNAYSTTLSKAELMRMDWQGVDLTVAIWYVACKSVMKLGRREVQELASNASQCNHFVNLIEEHCKDDIEELKTKFAKSQTPGKRKASRRKAAVPEVAVESIEEGDETVETPAQPSEDHMEGIVVEQTTPPPQPRTRGRPKRNGNPNLEETPIAAAPLSAKNLTIKKSLSTHKLAPEKPNSMVGFNRMVNHRDIRDSRRYANFLIWRENILAQIQEAS